MFHTWRRMCLLIQGVHRWCLLECGAIYTFILMYNVILWSFSSKTQQPFSCTSCPPFWKSDNHVVRTLERMPCSDEWTTGNPILKNERNFKVSKSGVSFFLYNNAGASASHESAKNLRVRATNIYISTPKLLSREELQTDQKTRPLKSKGEVARLANCYTLYVPLMAMYPWLLLSS